MCHDDSTILTVAQMQAVEQAAFERGIEPSALMEEAGVGIARVIKQFFLTPRTLLVYCGKGHNAGDALVAARCLAAAGWKVFIRLAFPKEQMALLVQAHLQELEKCYGALFLEENAELSQRPLVVLDGLLGIGSAGVPRDPVKSAIEEIHALRRNYNDFVVAVDLPSGLDGTTGASSEDCVEADLTVTIGYAKTGLVADRATRKVGRLALVFLNALKKEKIGRGALLTAEKLGQLLLPRSFDAHKGMFGHVGILAGSRGYLGAARLASAAALRAGAGLVTLYALPEIYELLASSVIPEVMVKPIKHYADLLSEPLTAVGIGPGLGCKHSSEIVELIEKLPIPCVIDADALNALSQELSQLLKCQGPRLLTPHPGEMERLFPAAGRCRADWVSDFVEHYRVTLLLKGARTIIAERGHPLLYNTTGHPGMSSAGMGDVLTGVTAAFLAQGHSCCHAAELGAWLCGRSAEIAIYEGNASSEALIASDVIDCLGRAIKSFRAGAY